MKILHKYEGDTIQLGLAYGKNPHTKIILTLTIPLKVYPMKMYKDFYTGDILKGRHIKVLRFRLRINKWWKCYYSCTQHTIPYKQQTLLYTEEELYIRTHQCY